MPTREPSPRARRHAATAVDLYRAYTALAEANRAEEARRLEGVGNRLYEAFQAGASVTELADELGVHRQRVYQLMDEAHARRIVEQAHTTGADPRVLADEQDATRRTRQAVDEMASA